MRAVLKVPIKYPIKLIIRTCTRVDGDTHFSYAHTSMSLFCSAATMNAKSFSNAGRRCWRKEESIMILNFPWQTTRPLRRNTGGTTFKAHASLKTLVGHARRRIVYAYIRVLRKCIREQVSTESLIHLSCVCVCKACTHVYTRAHIRTREAASVLRAKISRVLNSSLVGLTVASHLESGPRLLSAALRH